MNKQIIMPAGSDPHTLDQLDQMRREMQQDVRRHYQSRTVAVTIPFYQAAISGILAGILVAILLYAFGVKAKWILVGFGLTAIVVAGIVWWVRLKDWQELIWNMEQQMGIDLTGDQVIGKPATIRAEVTRNEGHTTTYGELEGLGLMRLFNAILNGEIITEARWTPERNGFSKAKYWHNINTLRRNGVLKWKNEEAHEQGVVITPEGPEILEQWIRDMGE